MSYVHFPVVAVMSMFVGGFLVVIFGTKHRKLSQGIALVTMLFTDVLIFSLFKPVILQGEVISYWMGRWNPVKDYAIGIGYEVDQLSLFFAMLISFVLTMSMIYSLRYLDRDDTLDRYYTLNLMLGGALLGIVMTGDIFNMFIMIEIMTFTAAALTAFRNKKAISVEAGFKYLVLGSVGSGFILSGVAVLYGVAHTLNMAQLSTVLSQDRNPSTLFAFALMFSGYALKSFLMPFHTPVPDAYSAAPASIGMLHSGSLNKCGIYALIRLTYILFRVMGLPAVQTMMVLIGSVTMFVAVTMALAQHDFKRLLAFHSISQMGYVVTALGLGTAIGLTGGLFHAINHSMFKGLLFLCAGAVYYAAGTTDLDRLGGLSKKMPWTTCCFIVGAFSISGIPPFNGFASKWMIYQATYQKAVTTGNIGYALVTVIAVVVSVMTLASFIKVTQAVFFGQERPQLSAVREVPALMRVPMVIMSLICVLFGTCYNLVNDFLLYPAVYATLNTHGYVDAMMGQNYAAASGMPFVKYEPVQFSFWNPVTWLVLFVIVLLAVFVVMMTGESDRGRVLANKGEEADGKFATFFSGEKSLPSHVGGSDLFWGFKKDFKKYFKVVQGIHSGIVNDYVLYAVCGLAFITVFMFVFVLGR